MCTKALSTFFCLRLWCCAKERKDTKRNVDIDLVLSKCYNIYAKAGICYPLLLSKIIERKHNDEKSNIN